MGVRDYIRRPSIKSYVPGLRDEITQPLYDYTVYKGGSFNALDFFVFPIGAQGKTETDTNLYHHGALPDGVMHFLTGFRIIALPDWPATRLRRKQDEQDVRRVLSTGLLEFRIRNRIYLSDGPLYKFPACFPTYEKDPEFLARGLRKTKRIKLARQAYYSIVPLFIQSQQCFGVRLKGLPVELNAPMRLGVIMDGRRIREAC